ncbi:MAG: hypothetical protein MI717_06110 [Spirochaetales bacterium]|nr:hypothetical protein [Spirochaetales bacterium]
MSEFTLIHQPEGNGQPYFQRSTERVPRKPIGGEPLAIFAQTQPQDAAERVWVEWTTDEWNTTVCTEGFCLGNTDSVGHTGEQRTWTTLLPSLPDHGLLQYRLCGDSGRGIVRTEEYGRSLRKRCSHEGASDVRFQNGAVEIYTPNGGKMRLAASSGGARLSWGDSTAAFPQEPSDFQALDSCKEGHQCFYAGEIYLDVSLNQGTFRLEHTGKGSVLECKGFAWSLQDEEDVWESSLRFRAAPDEGFYGFGERYNALNQRGQILQNRVFEQYTDQKLKTYLPIPFFYTGQNVGMLMGTRKNVEFNLCATVDDEWRITGEHQGSESLATEIFFGTPQEQIRRYARVTGLPASLPPWAFGPWMSANEWNTQERVMEVANKTRDLDIPASVLVIEAWSDETTFYIWNGAKYLPRDPQTPPRLQDFDFSESAHWPNPKAMIDELHERGIKVVLWQIPVLKALEGSHVQHEADQEYFIEQGLGAQEASGEPYKVRPGWFQGGLLPDFGQEATRKWWTSRRKYLLTEMGVDGFKTDGGEHLWGDDVQFSFNRTGVDMINEYPREYLNTYGDFVHEHCGKDGLTFSRAGYVGAQRTPCHWSGDQKSTWDAFRSAFFGMMNASLSGLPFIGWDMGGFSGDIPSAELYLRSVAASVFCPIMQYHAENNGWAEPCVDRTPWNIAERTQHPEVIDEYRKWAKLREDLRPYIEAEASHCCSTGEPLMRPLLVDFWENDDCRCCDDQYLFGRSLLVAPIFEEQAQERSVLIPPGEWQDVWTGKKISGPKKIHVKATLRLIPVYLRSGRNRHLKASLFQRFLEENSES